MHKPNLGKIFRTLKVVTIKHSPEILTGIGIAGMITSTVLAVQATPKAMKLIEEQTDDPKKLKKTEIVKIAWRPYVKSAVTGVISVSCIIGSDSICLKRNTVLASALTLSETMLSDYKDKVVEVIGEKKENQIRNSVAADKIASNPVQENKVFLTGRGDTLCYDYVSGRYFKHDINGIKKIVIDLNERLLTEMYISLNEYYYEIGLPAIGLGDDLGWNIDDGLIRLVEGNYGGATDGTPCFIVQFESGKSGFGPRWDYRNLY